jgi:hypothetical protein
MKNGVCPKCGKADVRQCNGAWCHRSRLALGFWDFWPKKLMTYVCAACGYIEDYVPEHDLAWVAKRGTRVDPSTADVGLVRD